MSKADEIENKLDSIVDVLMDMDIDDPSWDKLVSMRNELMIELEILENPVELQTDSIKSMSINKNMFKNN